MILTELCARSADALEEIGEAAVEPLIEVLKGKSYGRRHAVETLGRIGNVHAVKPLIASLRDSNPSVWEHLPEAEALGRIGNTAIETLIAALQDSSVVVRAGAVEALGRIGDARATESLIALLKDSNSMVRARTAEALGMIGDARAIEPLIAALKEDGNVRAKAADALFRLRDARSVDPLIASLKGWPLFGGPTAEAAQKIAEALGQIGDPRAVEPLISLLKSDPAYYVVRISAAEALGRIGDARAVEPLIAAFKSYWPVSKPGAEILGKRRTAEALGKIGDKRCVEHLLAALKDSSSYVRGHVALALRQTGDDAIERLITALKDSMKPAARARAAEALGKIGDARSVEHLLGALKDPDSQVRKQAADALAKLSDPRAVGALVNGSIRPKSREIMDSVGNCSKCVCTVYSLSMAEIEQYINSGRTDMIQAMEIRCSKCEALYCARCAHRSNGQCNKCGMSVVSEPFRG